MTEQEKYKEGQKKCGIEVGDTVRVVRGNKVDEDGSFSCSHGAEVVGKVGIVGRVGNAYIEVDHSRNSDTAWMMPYFVLEIVKKANGSVPGKVTDNTNSGESNMKIQEMYNVVVTENEYVKDAETSQIIATKKRVIFRHSAMPAYSPGNADVKAILAAGRVKGDDAIKDEDEVEVLVRPFCG